MEKYFNFNQNGKERRHVKYALVMFLPDDLNEMVRPIREQYDPLHWEIPAHITLVFPFETTRSLDDISNAITIEVNRSNPIAVTMDTIGDFYPDTPIVYWSVKDNPAIAELYYRLHARLDLSLPFKKLVPHVAVARELSFQRLLPAKEYIAANVSPEKFQAFTLDLVTPLVDNKWVSVRTFSLPI